MLLWCHSFPVTWTIGHIIIKNTTRTKESSALIITSHSDKDLIWIEDKEVRYQGKMFDINHIVHQENKLLLYGNFDNKDDNLFSWLNSALSDDEALQLPIFWSFDALIQVFRFKYSYTDYPLIKVYRLFTVHKYSSGYIASFLKPPITAISSI